MNRRVTALALIAACFMLPVASIAKTPASVSIVSSAIDPQFTLPSQSELAPYAATGTGRVTGRFNLVLSGTNSRLEYGNRVVYLLPAVTWSYVWAFTFARAVSQRGMRTLPFATWTHQYIRKAVTDAHGNFSFENVPPGKYVLASFVSSRVNLTTSYTTDDPEFEMRDSTDYDAGVERYEDSQEAYIQHNYTVHSSTVQCDVAAALESVVTVKAGDAETVAPVHVAGSRSNGFCN